jgi:glucosamine--fructose-6-phosphate aminotransferase (isomerizing)
MTDATTPSNPTSSDVRFDPEAPLPGPPDPWQASTMPAVRPGPPWALTEMIAAEPAFAERLLVRLETDDALARLVGAVRAAVAARERIVLTGCGTSEHGALGAASILRDAIGRSGADARIEVAQAFDQALDPRRGGLCIAVSHEGGTWATNRAIAAARANGARTALITVGTGSPGAALADIVVATREQDQAWCHTIGYISPLLVAAAVAAALSGDALDPVAVRGLMEAGHEPGTTASIEGVASALAGVDRLLVVGSGTDETTARELALKTEEGVHVPTVARHLESLLHGHLAATDASTGVVLVLVDRDGRPDRLARSVQALAATREIGLPAAVLAAESALGEIEGALLTAGAVAVPEAPALPAPVATLLGAAVPFQLLTERLAGVRGVNPDVLRRTEAPYLRSAERFE